MKIETKTTTGEPPILPKGHESGEIPAKPVIVLAVSLVLFLLVVVYLTRFFIDYPRVIRGSQLKFLLQSPFQLDPELRGERPLLQVAAPDDLRRFRAEEDRRLSTYGWQDKQAGKVHIPIDRAMEILVKRGLPARGEAQ